MLSSLILGMLFLSGDPRQDSKPSRPGVDKRIDPALQDEFNAMRAKAPNTADGHWKLGVWCEQKGLKDEAHMEYMLVCQLDPGRDAAWKKLGFVKHRGTWTTTAELTAARAEAEAQSKADARWRPLIQKWKTGLTRKASRAESEAALAAIKDPRAVPSIWRVFGTAAADDQERAVDMLGHVEGERASQALAGLALFGKTEPVRRAAVETLTRRNADDVLIAWIGLLRPPIKYEVRQVAGPGLPGVLLVEGEQFNARRFYSPPTDEQTENLFVKNARVDPLTSQVWPLQFEPNPNTQPPLGSRPVGEWHGTPLFIFDYTWAPPPRPKVTDAYEQFEKNQIQAQIDNGFVQNETAKMAAGAQAQLQHDVDTIEQANATIRERNARLSGALRGVSGKDLGDDREPWLKWWMEKRGFTYIPPKDRDKVTVDVQVALPYVPKSGPATAGAGGGGSGGGWCMLWEHDKGQQPRWGKCFTAGTAVLTPGGPRPIESLHAGELVLSGDGCNGAAHATPIIAVHRSSASRTLRLVVGGEAIGTTEGHPFAKLGNGWTRAGELKPGDEILATSGRARVEAIESGPSQTVWNLQLGGSHSYLVGRAGLVVHDISPIPTAQP
jgi:Pretoxin HINT domain